MISPASTRRFWDGRASALARRINVATWIARVAPAAFFVACGLAIVVYATRRAQGPLELAWAAVALVLAMTAGAAWWRARRAFFRPADARVLLESQLRLDTRLTAAELGLVEWPAIPGAAPTVVEWRMGAPAGWLLGAAAMLVAASFAPLSREGLGTRGAGAPPALLQTEAMLAALKDLNVAEPQAIEQLEQRARELARRPADEQYSHSALEAADALRNQTAVAAAGLARGMESAADALRSKDNSPDMKDSAGQLAAALSGLRDGALPANKDLLANLPANGADLKNLSAEQRAQLAEQLANAAQGLKGVAGAAGAGANVARPDPNAQGSEGRGAGAGGPGGGGDSAPLMLASQPSDAGDGSAQALSGDATKRLGLGDKLGTTSGTHEVDPAKSAGSTAAGAVSGPAAGGEAVWVNRLTPAERAALKNFFK